MPSRDYPERPFLAVSTALFRGGLVLIAERAGGAGAGLYSLPGGMVELGETLEAAALRELREETGLAAEIAGFVQHLDIIHRDAAGRVKFHAAVAVFAARWTSGEPRITPEASAFKWVKPGEVLGLPITKGLSGVLKNAERAILRTT